MPCSHCGGVGHTYVKCPQLTPEQIKEKKDAILNKKEEKEKKKKMKERRKEMYTEKDYIFRNNNIPKYWTGTSKNATTPTLRYIIFYNTITYGWMT